MVSYKLKKLTTYHLKLTTEEDMFYWFVNLIIGLLARILFRIQITGLENIPGRGAFILASNHRSNLDPVIIAIVIKRKLYFLGKKELFRSKFSTKIFTMLNIIELNREGIDRAALKRGLIALHKGRGLLLFPEGKRSVDGRLGMAKPGVALFALGTGVPVIPAFIKGTEKALPPRTHFIRPARIKLIFDKGLIPLKVTDRASRKSDYQEFTNRIMERIAELGKEAA